MVLTRKLSSTLNYHLYIVVPLFVAGVVVRERDRRVTILPALEKLAHFHVCFRQTGADRAISVASVDVFLLLKT